MLAPVAFYFGWRLGAATFASAARCFFARTPRLFPNPFPSLLASPCNSLSRERRRSESNRRIEVLQTSALPLGYGASASKAHQKGLLHQVRSTGKHLLIVL